MRCARLAAILLLAVVTVTAACVRTAAEPPPGELLVFAAASLTDALVEIGAAFEAREDVRVLFSFGGSNALARQILAGAPADLFVSANLDRMDELERAGLVRPRDRVELLSNRLAVVVSVRSALSVSSPADLQRARRLALGDPEAVPAGIYARRWLAAHGLWAGLHERVIPTLDVRAALGAVESGSADVAIVYRTDAALSGRVRVAFEIPPEQTPGIVYPASVLTGSTSVQARLFLIYLQSREAHAVFTRLGFEPLEGS
jgi:molybdate transport system substrate-binding protein